jgi:RHH-type proline utilization regulon transcriptional repressor/proline dehydrogenase/delta 1-pyrroline-5-carboxylate dehydrogenase
VNHGTREPEGSPGAASADLERRIQQVGREIFAQCRSAVPTVLHGDWWQQRLLEWAMHDDALRTQLFRFIDVLPALHTSTEVAEHLREYLLGGRHVLPRALERALRFGPAGALGTRVAAIAARRNVRQIARRFIAGETPDEGMATVQRLRAQRMAFTLDVLGEAITSESQADAYAQRYLELIDRLTHAAQTWPHVAQIDAGPAGRLPRVNVSLKLSALYSQFDAIAPSRSAEAVGRRLRAILRRARERGAFVHVDMEEYAHKNLVLDIFKSIFMEDEFRDCTNVGIVIQAYLQDAEEDLHALGEWAQQRGHPIVGRLVKGAYWDTETVHAVQRGWRCPVFTHKWETDATFERLTRYVIAHHALLQPAIASHNVRSLAHAIVLAEHCGLSVRDYEIQLLYGMGDALKAALVERGQRLRVYTPYGPLIPGMAYLIRRLLENTSNDSFLRQSFTEHLPIDELLANPEETRPASAGVPAPIVIDADGSRGTPAFTNEPLTDFSAAANRAAMAAAIDDVRGRRCGAMYPLIIGAETLSTARWLDSFDPSHASFLVGRIACATNDDAQRAVAAARGAWPGWRQTPVQDRAVLLRRMAGRMRQRRLELAAWAVIETGKPWREADADVAEAIDYCAFYAREMERLHRWPRQRHFPGEENYLIAEPRGVAVIIAPWNFPLAILTGMTTAALVAGNTVVVKPAEQSSVIGAKFFELLAEAGLPPGVANFLPGVGEEVGAHLVTHPDVDVIAFTGSRAVGLQIIEAAARRQAGQRTVKRAIAEMGGKNAIIIDADADVDEAVKGVVVSAFGYAGQKCSACSRVIVLGSVHDAFVHRLIEAARSLQVGPAEDPASVVGPVIDAEACDKVLAYIERGRQEAEVVCQVECDNTEGYFVGPVIFDQVPPHAVIAREEIFGPVLAVITAASFDDALAIANDSDYALTGGVYSRRPAHIAQARRGFRVGNLYVNRPITGAIVDRQPFGGLKLSGVGSKAGGPDYLQQFCEPKTISENTLRHGFAPTEPGA